MPTRCGEFQSTTRHQHAAKAGTTHNPSNWMHMVRSQLNNKASALMYVRDVNGCET